MPGPDEVVDGNLPNEEPQDEVVETEVVEDEEEVVEDEPREEEFVDPSQLPRELQPHWKKMQASYTRKMQGVKELQDKANLYDQIMSDPENIVSKLAEKAGLKVVKEESNEEDIPEGGDATLQWLQSQIKKAVDAAVGPIRGTQQQLKVSQSMSYLDKTYPDWKLYDDIMTDIVKKHPSMSEDLDLLYETARGRASNYEQKKAGSLKKAAVVTKASTAGRNVVTTPTKINSLDDAINAAKKQLGYK